MEVTALGKLEGQTVIVTGASRGIGVEIARVLAAEGGRVVCAAEGGRVVCAARTLHEGDHPLEGSLEHTVAGIRDAGHEAAAVVVNISEADECERLVQETRSLYGPVGRAGEQRGALLLPAGDGLRGEPLDALVGGERPRAVHPEPPRAGGHGPAQERPHRQHLVVPRRLDCRRGFPRRPGEGTSPPR